MKNSDEEKIRLMVEGGQKLAQVRRQLAEGAQPGVKLIELEKQADQWLQAAGGKAAFKLVKGYHWATCINVNQGVVHGIPGEYVIQDGDIVSIDVGLFYKGYNTDTSVTVGAGEISKEGQTFLQTGRLALKKSIAAAKPGRHVWHISRAMQEVVEGAGYAVVRSLTGHGVGKDLHQIPNIPCYAIGGPKDTPELKIGQTLAIEVIYTLGNPELTTEADGWTISTRDGKIAALFEETIAVTETGPVVLTK